MVTRLLEAKPELFRVLVNEDDEDQIFAWSCADRDVTHFVFVKRPFRGEGLSKRLFDSGIVTHWTRACEDMQHIYYEPSLFQELINGISKTGNKELINENNRPMGDSSPENDELSGQVCSDAQGRQPGQAVGEAVGVVS
jgi:hypothetical protein